MKIKHKLTVEPELNIDPDRVAFAFWSRVKRDRFAAMCKAHGIEIQFIMNRFIDDFMRGEIYELPKYAPPKYRFEDGRIKQNKNEYNVKKYGENDDNMPKNEENTENKKQGKKD